MQRLLVYVAQFEWGLCGGAVGVGGVVVLEGIREVGGREGALGAVAGGKEEEGVGRGRGEGFLSLEMIKMAMESL